MDKGIGTLQFAERSSSTNIVNCCSCKPFFVPKKPLILNSDFQFLFFRYLLLHCAGTSPPISAVFIRPNLAAPLFVPVAALIAP